MNRRKRNTFRLLKSLFERCELSIRGKNLEINAKGIMSMATLIGLALIARLLM